MKSDADMNEIRESLKNGDVSRALNALEELLAKEPENVSAKMLYGTCCWLMGDEKTFLLIHNEIAPEMKRREKIDPRTDEVRMWKKFNKILEIIVLGALVFAAVAGLVVAWGNEVANASRFMMLYGPAPYHKMEIGVGSSTITAGGPIDSTIYSNRTHKTRGRAE